jgi:hypothetical protein
MFYNEGMSEHCSATKRDGTPCRGRAVRGSEPPLCAAHGGGRVLAGAPEGAQDTLPCGFQVGRPTCLLQPAVIPDDIDSIIHDLAIKQARLSEFINGNLDGLDTDAFLRLLALHAQTASRLGRLLRDRQQLAGAGSDDMSEALTHALDQLAIDLEVEL